MTNLLETIRTADANAQAAQRDLTVVVTELDGRYSDAVASRLVDLQDALFTCQAALAASRTAIGA